MKYFCRDCGSYFNELFTRREYHPEQDRQEAYEEFDECPICNSDDYIDAYICSGCGCDTNDEVAVELDDRMFCPDCIAKMDDAILQGIELFHNEFGGDYLNARWLFLERASTYED